MLSDKEIEDLKKRAAYECTGGQEWWANCPCDSCFARRTLKLTGRKPLDPRWFQHNEFINSQVPPDSERPGRPLTEAELETLYQEWAERHPGVAEKDATPPKEWRRKSPPTDVRT